MSRRLARALAPPARRYRPLTVCGAIAGWIDDARAETLASHTDVFHVRPGEITFTARLDDASKRTTALARVARTLAGEGRLTAWRDERYAVAPAFGAPPWFLLERAAARYFGIQTWAAHMNGLVCNGDVVSMWVARRSPTKSIDPSLLDNLVGGGIAAGGSVEATIVREAWEEAGIGPSLAQRARSQGSVHVCRDQPDGLQRESIFVHDLWLSADFVPACQDGEAVAHRLLPLADVARLIANERGADVMTADASLVALDCLLRLGAISIESADYAALDALRRPWLAP